MKRLILIALIIASATTARAQILAVKTNALADVVMAPNVGFELAVGNSMSVNLNAYFGGKMLYGDNRMQAFNPEFRYYPISKVMDKLFVGISSYYAHYDLNFNRENFMGDAAGGGITFGWVLPLTRFHWNIEFEAGVGIFYYEHKRTYHGDYEDPNNRRFNEHGVKFQPFKLGVNFCYIFRYKNEVDSKVKRVKKVKEAEKEANPLIETPAETPAADTATDQQPAI